ncbi:MAG: twin-arginine translocase TatA/TatE family subunit [Terriglobales bacterium]
MNLGMTEMIFLVLLGLLLFGPKKLPEIGRQLGKVLNEFKRASNEFQSQLNDEVRKLEVEEADATPAGGAPEGTTAREESGHRLQPNSGEHTGETPGEDAVVTENQPERQNG